MKSSTANNVIPFRKSQELHRFNVIPHEWRVLANEEGKRLSEKELQTLWTLKRLAEHQQTDQLIIDYAFLIYQCGFDCSQRQMSRYLNAIKNSNIISYKTQNAAHGYKKKIHIQLDYKILENLMTDSYDSQVCRSNMVRYNIDKNKLQNKELDSFSKKKESNSKKEIKNKEKCQSADLLSFPSGAANHADPHAKVTEQIPIPEQQPINEYQEDKPVGAYNWEDPKIKLDLAISRNFDIATATMLTVDIDYRYHEAMNKVKLIPKQKLAISEEHKGRLKQIIKGVYGEDVTIVQSDPEAKKDDVVKRTHNQEKFSSIEQKPPEIDDFSDKPLTQKVIKNLVDDGIDKALINSWLNSVRVKIIEYENQIIFECSDFTAEQIINRFISSLMQSCKEFDLEIIFLARDRLDEVREIKITEKGKW